MTNDVATPQHQNPRDVPMNLGDHLEELRNRILRVVIALGVVIVIAFGFQAGIKQVLVEPLYQAISLVSDATLEHLNISREKAEARKPVLSNMDLTESPVTSVRVSFYAAVLLVFPYLVWQVWAFCSPALFDREVKAAFLFVPGAVLFFYGGVVFGYFIGLPYFFSWLLEWAASDPTADAQLRQSYYFTLFFTLVLCFGAVMDIPWLVLVLLRVRLVTPEQMGRARRYVIMSAVVVAAMLSPPDPFSQLALFIPMVVLFEAGLFIGRILYSKRSEPEQS